MKKKYKILLGIIFLVLGLNYLRLRYLEYQAFDGNNVCLGIVNTCKYPVEAEIYVDNIRIMKDSIIPTGLHLCIRYGFNLSPGYHDLRIVMDGDELEFDLFVFFVRYLVVEYTANHKKSYGPFLLYRDYLLPSYVSQDYIQLSVEEEI